MNPPGFLDDVRTMIWKEWREMFAQKATARSGILASVVMPLAVLGILLPAQFGRQFVSQPLNALVWLWLPLFLILSIVADSFAGERERKTLETLLASRLPDEAILAGKVAAAVIYGFAVSMGGFVLGVITVNVIHGKGEVLLPGIGYVLTIAGASLLGAGLAAGAGVLMSIRAATVRQAQQTLMLSVMGAWFGLIFGFQALPEAWQQRITAAVGGANLLRTEITVGLTLFAIDALLLVACARRFKRARLILD